MTAPQDTEPSVLLELAHATAREAGELITRMYAEGVSVADTKSSPTDVVTQADRACEQLIRDRLLGSRPDDGFIGEESDDTSSSSGVVWIVDPIDGTVNYLYGLPQHAVSIAAAVDGVVVAGVVLAPAAGLEYAATLGGGAQRNGVLLPRRGTARPLPPISQTLVATGFGYEAVLRRHQAACVGRMLPQVRDIRRIGSCALDVCAVAAGECDAYAEEGTHVWDHAAAGLVARECGVTTEVWATPRGNELLVCAPEDTWAEFSQLVRSCGFAAEAAPEPTPEPAPEPAPESA